MPTYTGNIRIGTGIARAFSTMRAWAGRVAEAWGRIQSNEERRFKESMGIEPEDENEPEVQSNAPCNAQESAPNLADIVRKRQASEPSDFMFEPERNSHEED